MTKNKIIWLVSYPKSGNTWTRLFLHALNKNIDEISELKDLDTTSGIASGREVIEGLLGCNTDDMPDIEIQKLRAEAYKKWTEIVDKELIVKVHDAAYHRGYLTFPKEVTKKVIFIVRNPFDMVASYANHMNCSIEKAVFMLCDGKNQLANNKYRSNNQVTQFMGSWSDFYHSWKNLYREDLFVMRYEDMKNDSFNTFKKLAQTIGWDKTDEEILNAIKTVEFDKIKQVEIDKGFKEKPISTKSFFRKGQMGAWRNEITPEMAKFITDRHFYTLLEFGYINEKGDILV